MKRSNEGTEKPADDAGALASLAGFKFERVLDLSAAAKSCAVQGTFEGKEVGHLQVGGYGHTLGGAVGIGFVELDVPLTSAIVDGGTWQIDVAGVRINATASLRPLYDPTMERIRG